MNDSSWKAGSTYGLEAWELILPSLFQGHGSVIVINTNENSLKREKRCTRRRHRHPRVLSASASKGNVRRRFGSDAEGANCLSGDYSFESGP